VSTATAFEVLRERNFRYLFAARTTSFFGMNLAPIAVAFAVLGLTGYRPGTRSRARWRT
jgi:hypothetical protein